MAETFSITVEFNDDSTREVHSSAVDARVHDGALIVDRTQGRKVIYPLSRVSKVRKDFMN